MRLQPLKWSGKHPVPAIGECIEVRMNGLGRGTVEGYFEQEGYLGVVVALEDPPEWFTRQNHGNPPTHLFGLEIGPIRHEATFVFGEGACRRLDNPNITKAKLLEWNTIETIGYPSEAELNAYRQGVADAEGWLEVTEFEGEFNDDA